MATIRYNKQTMNMIPDMIDDGNGGVLDNGILTCKAVIAENIQAINVNVKNNVSVGESLAIGRDVAIGNSVVCPNIYSIKSVSNTLETKKIKTEKIHLYNNLLTYEDTNVGYIKTSSIVVSTPLLATNTISSIVSLPLPIGVYMVSYSFSLALSGNSNPALHSITHGLSTDNANLNVIQKKHYGNIVFNNIPTYVEFHETAFYHITDYNSSLYFLAIHNRQNIVNSRVLIQNGNITAMRIA